MSTGLLEQRVNYPNTQYEYGYGADGSADADGDNRKEIDCSHLLHLMLKDAGYTIPYRSTSQLKTDSTYFDTVALADVQPGDIALWTGASLNHTGVVETIGANRDRGEFFGSQTSTGPKSARFGAGAPFWPMPSQYLRPKPEFRTGAQSAPYAPAPAPAAEPLKVKVKSINWAYPFKTAGEASTEISDPQLYFDALAKAKDGFYPMGANGLWHGGVHFDGRTGALLDQSAVRCIADGEVIAYRIDDKYPETPHTATIRPGMGPEPLGAKYSTGFVLVKHCLALPPTPPPATPAGESSPTDTMAETPAAAPTAEKGPASEGLIFYSLYMHLLDWTSYQVASAPKPPAFLAPSKYAVKPTADDPLLGLRVRALHDNGTTEVLALLPKGCTVTLGETHPLKPQFKQLLSVDEGAAIPALSASATGWVYAPELTGTTVANKAKDTEPALTLSHQGLNVRQEGKIIGVLPRGAMLKVGEKQSSGYCKVLEVMDYRGVPALPNGPDGKPLGYVFFDELDTQQSEPINRGHVHLLPEPHAIKAGELVGHIGLYQNQGEDTAKPRLHLEVFSCEDVPAFIAKSRTLAASLPAEQKTLLKIHKGASKLIPHNDAINASNPPKITDTGVTIDVELTIPVNVLESLPTERKIQVSEAVRGSTTPRITRWWRLDDLLADAAGNRISGWLAEQDMITTRHSPWEWEGFDYISETTSSTEQLANHLAGQCLLSEAELPDYQMHISTADNGPIKTRLYDIIDGADGSVRDDILSVKEIKAALKKTWHAQSISRLITHYESEWFWQDAKWDELDKLMEHTEEDPNPQWVKEKERIQKLCWWSEVAESLLLDGTGNTWHLNSIAMVSNFTKRRSCNCNLTVKVTRWKSRSTGNTYYGPVHWGTNRLSQATQWDNLISAGKITADDKEIICVMTENEGKIEAVQSYDSEIITAGAMQKTINTEGTGEFPSQVKRFKEQHPSLYIDLFESQGWHLDHASALPKMFYQHADWKKGVKLEGQELKASLRDGCNESTVGKDINCLPVSSIACAISSPEYIQVQIIDYIERLRDALAKKPTGYTYSAGKLFRTKLGKALVLDQDINRPGYVANDLKTALDKFYSDNPTISRDIDSWGEAHTSHEQKIIEYYGPERRMTEANERYEKLKQEL